MNQQDIRLIAEASLWLLLAIAGLYMTAAAWTARRRKNACPHCGKHSCSH